jgi:thymidylate synthase
MNENFKPYFVESRDLPDLWFRAVYDILQKGQVFKIDKGSFEGQKRLEYDFFIGHVRDPSFGSGTHEILPQIPPSFGIPNPVDLAYVYGGEGYSRSYVEYVMTPRKEPGESYTYGERLTKARLSGDKLAWWEGENDKIINRKKEVDGTIVFEEDGELFLNQIEEVIDTYKRFGLRNNQLVLQVAEPTDRLLKDPPCLRQIDTRIQDGRLHFIVTFRSWDLWAGLPANLAAIEYLQKYMALCVGVEQGEMIVESKGLHLYDYVWELAQKRTQLEGIIKGKE